MDAMANGRRRSPGNKTVTIANDGKHERPTDLGTHEGVFLAAIACQRVCAPTRDVATKNRPTRPSHTPRRARGAERNGPSGGDGASVPWHEVPVTSRGFVRPGRRLSLTRS